MRLPPEVAVELIRFELTMMVDAICDHEDLLDRSKKLAYRQVLDDSMITITIEPFTFPREDDT